MGMGYAGICYGDQQSAREAFEKSFPVCDGNACLSVSNVASPTAYQISFDSRLQTMADANVVSKTGLLVNLSPCTQDSLGADRVTDVMLVCAIVVVFFMGWSSGLMR